MTQPVIHVDRNCLSTAENPAMNARPGITIEIPFALVVAMICRCGQVEEEEARDLAAELLSIIGTWRAWCAEHPERLGTEFEEEDVTFTVLRTVVGCWPRIEGWQDDEKNEKVHDEADESVWLMCHLTDVSDELYERYLKVSDRILGEDLASLLSHDESMLPLPKEKLQ
jgi:hypothetical protein